MHCYKKYAKIFLTGGLPFSISGINLHNQLKNKSMKLVKLSVVALSLGLFVASCGNGGDAAKTNVDSMNAATSTSMTTTTAPATPAPADTIAAGAAKPDSAAAAAASKTTTTTETKSTETKKEKK
jgi:hypothetical protein